MRTSRALSREQATAIVDGLVLYDTASADAFMNENVYPLDRPLMEQRIDAIGSLLAAVHPEVDPDEAQVDGRFVRELAG